MASLPMYDITEVRAAVGDFWCALAAEMQVSSDLLAWPSDLESTWLHPELLLSQTCGLPLIERLATRVQVLGTFRYTGVCDEQGCYRSVLIAREYAPIATFVGKRAAINSWGSLSGWASLAWSIDGLVPPAVLQGLSGQRAVSRTSQ